MKKETKNFIFFLITSIGYMIGYITCAFFIPFKYILIISSIYLITYLIYLITYLIYLITYYKFFKHKPKTIKQYCRMCEQITIDKGIDGLCMICHAELCRDPGCQKCIDTTKKLIDWIQENNYKLKKWENN